MQLKSRRARLESARSLSAALHAAAVSAGLLGWGALPAWGLDRVWIGGNATWTDGGDSANWNPADEPDADDTAIFNTANSVSLGSDNTVLALTLSGGIDLSINGFSLTVDGLVQASGASTNLFINGAASQVDADDVTINADATVELSGGTLLLDEESGSSLLDINAGGNLQGNGVITFADLPIVATTLLVNDGELTALSRGLTIITPPPVGTLQINDSSIGGRVDLDGAGEAGVVSVNRNQTLDLNVPFSDAFNGTLNLRHNTTFDSSSGWTLGAGGVINADNGFVDGTFPNPDIPASTSTIAGGALTQTGGTINVVDTDGTLIFDAPFTMTGGGYNNQGHTIFNAATSISAAATFLMGPSGSDLTVGPGAAVTITQISFNLDGTAAGTVITVGQLAQLTLDLGDYDNDAATNSFDGTVNLNGGIIDVTTSDAEFVMNATLNMVSIPGSTPTWTGEPLDIGNDLGVVNAQVNVSGNGFSHIATPVDFNSDANVTVAAGSTLQFVTAATVNFDTVNGATNAQFAGSGTIIFNGVVNVNEAVTLNMVGGTVDLDGNDSVGEFINIDAPMTINAATLTSFGKINGGGGVNTLDINNSVGTGVLTVNLDSPASEWTLNSPGVMNLVNDNTEATLLAGSDVNLNGTVNVTGDVRTTARVDFGSTAVVNINTAAQPLRLAGGDSVADVNTMFGGTISGVGLLGADNGKALHGFGVINTGIDFDGSASLRADNGTLTINGAILDAGQVGTADNDGTLHVTNAWNNNVTTGVHLNGGVVSGGVITNDVAAGISGRGLVMSRVINNTQLFTSAADTLIFQTPGNDNDWDGVANTGALVAANGSVLELRDAGAAFGFLGQVSAVASGRVFANGFALDFNPGSTLVLGSSTYESTSSTDIGGTVTINAGGISTIKVQNNFFLTFETGSNTTLNADLRLQNNNINIEAGATFSGAGALVVPDGSHVVMDNLAQANVLLNVEGAFRPGNSEGIGRVQLLDYQQRPAPADVNAQLSDAGGELFVELTGTALNQYDRLIVDGTAQIGGYLSIDIDGAFVPSLGQQFNIITASGIIGTFDRRDISGMPGGLTFHVGYLLNAVQLTVVDMPFFEADFDSDGDVDATDLAIWRGAYNLNQLGDANGDNRTDGADWTIWREQFGSVPGPPPGMTVPEPGACGLLLLGCAAGALRRRSRRDAHQPSRARPVPAAQRGSARRTVTLGALAALACALTSQTASAIPTLTVSNAGPGTWTVSVAPDPALFVNGKGALSVELGFDILGGGDLLSAAKSASTFPYENPGFNPFTSNVTIGINVNTVTDKLFMSLGSNVFTTGDSVSVATITTSSGPMTLSWGGHLITGNGPSYTGSRISQDGVNYNGYQGQITIGLPGDFEPDGDVDADDIDALLRAVQGPVPPALPKFDLTGNNNVNSAPNTADSDSDYWVRTIKGTEYGDANLDGVVDITDLGLLATNWQAGGQGWATADFNGDDVVDITDLGLLATNWQAGANSPADSSSLAAALAALSLPQGSVPEPAAALLAALLPAASLLRRRRTSRVLAARES